MTTQKERDVYEEATIEVIKTASGKNPFAFDYLWNIACISRTVDDIYDQDQVVSRDDLLEVFDYLFIKLPTNPFFNQHRSTLLSQHISMWNAWMAANLR